MPRDIAQSTGGTRSAAKESGGQIGSRGFLVFTRSTPRLRPRSRWLWPPALLVAVLLPIPLFHGLSAPDHSKHGTNRHRDTAGIATHQAVLTVEPSHPGKQLALGAIGLSVEAKELATSDLNADHESLVALMRLLGPAVLRLGGGSADDSWWTSRGEPAPTWATSVVTPTDIEALNRLLAATGWRAILALDLGHFEPSRAADEVRVAGQILGRRLLGFEIGNEPDVYSKPVIGLRATSYGPANYLEELASLRAAAPRFQVYGPDASSPTWLQALATSGDTSFAAITAHFYPTSYSVGKGGCQATGAPTALDLLSPQVRERETAALKVLVDAGHAASDKTRISETNATGSCDTTGGPATSPVFASALWSLDWALRATSAGVDGVNFHGYLGHCRPYTGSPICANTFVAQSKGEVMARPEYYGLLAARQLEGAQFVPVHIAGNTTAGEITAYATKHPHGSVTVAIDNLTAQHSTSVALSVPGYGSASGAQLTGPGVSATSGVTFGQVSVNAKGGIAPRHGRIRKMRHAFHLTLPAASAIVVTLHR